MTAAFLWCDNMNVNNDFDIDNDYSEITDTIENILSPLCFIAVGIPMLFIYWYFIKREVYIMPYSYINYISSNYNNIIEDNNEENNLKMCNRWNYSQCDCSFPRV